MSARVHNFDLRLLTASKDVGLRRLRSYTATLGGAAQIFHAFQDLQRSLEHSQGDRQRRIVLHDGTIILSSAQLEALNRHARVFMLERPDQIAARQLPGTASPSWRNEAYLRCSLNTFLEAPVLRMTVAHLCRPDHAPFHLAHLLRWGHTVQSWTPDARRDVVDAAVAFIRELALVGEGRRLTEMFSHFIETRLPTLGLAPESVIFGCDGLLTLVTAVCRQERAGCIPPLAAELSINDFPFAVVNHRPDGLIEVGALAHLSLPSMPGQTAERVLAVCNQAQAEADAGAVPAADAGLRRAG